MYFQVYEHDTLKVDAQFTPSHFERLVQFGERTDFRYFTAGYNRIKFRQFVGVFQVGEICIEVLPKVDRHTESPAKWQRFLLEMLAINRYIKPETTAETNVTSRHAPLIEVFVRQFLDEVHVLVHRGLVKQYRTAQGNVFALKGQLKFAQHLSQNLIHQERFFTEHATHSFDHPFHQLLKQALMHVASSTISSATIQRARQLLLHFETVSISATSSQYFTEVFAQLSYTRRTAPYRDAMRWAELLLQHHSPDLHSGTMPVLAIAFDMNQLFEGFCYHQFKKLERTFAHLNLHVERQISKRFWHTQHIRPDLLLTFSENGKAKRLVLDTKWKTVISPSDTDLKQLYTYCLQFNADEGILLYPKTNTAMNLEHAFSVAPSLADTPNCRLIFIDISNFSTFSIDSILQTVEMLPLKDDEGH